MRRYKIPKGKHTTYNLHRLWNRFFPKRVKKNYSLHFKAEILSMPYDIRPDADQNDRHKLVGLPLKVFSKGNKNAALVSFQPNAETGKWDIAPYFNDDFDFDWGEELNVPVGEVFRGEIKFIQTDTVKITIEYLNKTVEMKYKWDFDAKYTGFILPWHGGKDNDGNGLGGVSPKDLYIKLDLKWKN